MQMSVLASFILESYQSNWQTLVYHRVTPILFSPTMVEIELMLTTTTEIVGDMPPM